MLSYKDFTKYFGSKLSDKDFHAFLVTTFSDLTDYDILNSDYITSKDSGIDLGFTNNEAIYDDDTNIVFEKGQAIFSHLIFWPKSTKLINRLPFDATFNDIRIGITTKAGLPTQTKEGYMDLLNKSFLVDNYKLNDIIITFDYEPNNQTINFVQIRENNLVEHLKL